MVTADRKRLGSWPTPHDLVERVVDNVLDAEFVGRRASGDRGPLRVIDPACGDGRFLGAVHRRVAELGGEVELVGIDLDRAACDEARAALPAAEIVHADALAVHGWRADQRPFDVVIGNPPYLSQMAEVTARGGSSTWGGGPYADAAVEFLGLAAELVDRAGGRVTFVLPQSILSARDAGPVRDLYDSLAAMVWSWWSPEQVFDAQVYTCAVAFEFGLSAGADRIAGGSWARVVTSRTGVPVLPDLDSARGGTLGDRAWLNANFRDEYYGMVPAVADHETGPPLITSGLIDPGRSLWGHRSVRFAKQRWAAPRVDLRRLDDRMQRWAARRLVPKALVANQTSILEVACDPDGEWLPGVPVVGIYPNDSSAEEVWRIAAVLTSPVASAWAWHRQAGTGLSADTIRVGPVLLAGLPWPSGSDLLVAAAATALRSGDVRACGGAICRAYGLPDDSLLTEWWERSLRRIERRQNG
jgi:hypothetical protein